MNSVPIGVCIGLLLLSLAPHSLILVIRVRLSAIISQEPTTIQAVATSFLCLLDILVFGFPQKIFAIAPFTVAFLVLAICTGILYYLVEDWRLRIVRPGAMRVTKWVFPMGTAGALPLVFLLGAAIAEEILFRWYALVVPPTYGILPVFACIFVSSGAFAISHEHFGRDVMLSRGVFGLMLTLPVLLWGNLLFPIVAHMVYNALVQIRPVQYIQIKKGV